MSSKVARKSPTVRKTAAAQSKARRSRAARARRSSLIDSFMAWVPFNEAQLHSIFLGAILVGGAVLAWTMASLAGLPQMAGQKLAAVAADAGFEVRRVEVRGVRHLNELSVYERALSQRSRAMPLVDIEGLRSELMELSWVEDARVSRQLPDTLVIDIVERRPHAVLRKNGGLVLIDSTGHELEPVGAARAKGKLVLSGMGAGKQVAALSGLLAAVPAMKPQVREAAWIGNRRWNLTFKSGQVLALPEGKRPAANALASFARLDGANRLIGGRIAAFDMRAPGRIYLRVPGRSGDSSAKPAGEEKKE